MNTPGLRRNRIPRTLAVLGVVLLGLIPTLAQAEVILTPHALDKKVKQYIIASTPLGDENATLLVETMNLPEAPISLKGEALTISFQDSRSIPMTMRTIVQVTFTTEEETRRIGIPVRLAVEKPVWVTNRFIRAKEAITSKDVTLQRRRLELEAPYCLGQKENVTRYSTIVNLSPGAILDARQVSQTPVVYRNDDVRMVMSMSSGVSIRLIGKAMEDGVIGKRIRVKQERENEKPRIYIGEVIDRGTVLVKL